MRLQLLERTLGAMDPHHEAAEIRNVQARLAERFPDLDPGIVETAVAAAHAELTGNIRDFVPVLVEHGARDRLSAIVRGDAANGVTGPVT